MNRRDFLLSTSFAALSATALTASRSAEAFLLRPVGGGLVAALSVQTTVTMANTSATASGTNTPIEVPQWFARATVPSGSVAVPSVAGQSITWQADCLTYWDDGSLRGAVFAIVLPTGIGGSATLTVTFTVQVGTYSNTSSITLATLAEEAQSNYHIQLYNLHTTQPFTNGPAGGKNFQGGFTIDPVGGTVNGSKIVWLNDSSSTVTGTYTCSYGGPSGGAPTTNASVTFSSSAQTITINSGGSGYGYMGTNGQFSAGFQQSYALYVANGNFVGVQFQQYKKGPACDAWEWRCPYVDSTSGTPLPGMVQHGWIERWKTPGGALLSYRCTTKNSNAALDTSINYHCYTFDLDWKNGSTVIRGVSNGDTEWETIFLFILAGFFSTDTGAGNPLFCGLADWSANDTAYKSIFQQRTSTEWDQLVSTGMMPPFLTTFNGVQVGGALTMGSGGATTPTGFSVSSPPTAQYAYNIGVHPTAPAVGLVGDELTQMPLCNPLAQAGIASPYEGSGGGRHNEGWFEDSGPLVGVAIKSGYPTQALSWLAMARGAAINFASGANSIPLWDTTTFYMPCVVPSTTQAFGNMPDTSKSLDISSIDAHFLGYPNGILHQGSGSGNNCMTTYHLARYAVVPYLLEGTRWLLSNLVDEAGVAIWYPTRLSASIVSEGTVGLGAATYYGMLCCTSQYRQFGLAMMTVGYTAAILPPKWADGTNNYEQQYLRYITKNNFDFLNALVPYVGNLTHIGGATNPKVSWAGSGVWALQRFYGTGYVTEWYYTHYVAYMLSVLAYIWQDQGSGQGIGAIKQYLNYHVLAWAAMWATPGYSHYVADAWAQSELQGDGTNGAPWSDWNWTDPGIGFPGPPKNVDWVTQSYTDYPQITTASAALNFVSGDPDVRVSIADACGTFTGYISGTTLTVTSASWPYIAKWAGVGYFLPALISGAGVAADTVITAQGTGTGGTGTYTVNVSQTVGSAGSPITFIWVNLGGMRLLASGSGITGGSTIFPSGSAIVLTQYDISISDGFCLDPATGSAVAVPSGFSIGTIYYIANQTPASGEVQTIRLYLTQSDALANGGAGNTNYITPGSTVNNMQFWGTPYSFTMPPDTSVYGTYNGQESVNAQARVALARGTLCLMKAYAFNAPEDSAPYPALDSLIGINDAIGQAVSNTQNICLNVAGTGLNFEGVIVEANDSSL
jgi:hypothetical protein